MNDNTTDNKIIRFKPRKIETEERHIATVFVKEGLVGIDLLNPPVLLTPENALKLVVVMVSALKAIHEMKLNPEK